MKMEQEDESREFYFESDHLALRNNHDYRSILRYIVSLECQKIAIIKDIENLHTIQKEALEDPLRFLENFKNGSITFPPTYPIPEIPVVNWSAYGVSQIPTSAKDKPSEPEQENPPHVLIRGRVFDQSKPQTFNQLWTCEEQKRLEELLKEYPDEEIEMRRWVKIANALGNRTPKQVMSRVQKYFIKLQQVGLPIPGRIKKIPSKTIRTPRNNAIFQKKSTFFPDQHVPVLMDEQSESSQRLEYNECKEWTTLELMHAVYERKKIEEMSEEPLPIHKGVACIGCKIPDIVGTCWTDGFGASWCSDCLIEHQPSTRMIPLVHCDSIN